MDETLDQHPAKKISSSKIIFPRPVAGALR
jgi:hypothetical protein